MLELDFDDIPPATRMMITILRNPLQFGYLPSRVESLRVNPMALMWLSSFARGPSDVVPLSHTLLWLARELQNELSLADVVLAFDEGLPTELGMQQLDRLLGVETLGVA